MTSKYRFDQNGTLVDPDAYFLLRTNFPGLGLPPPAEGGGTLANGGYAWGMNDDNQVGMGTNGAAAFFATPQLIAGGFTPFILGTNKSFTATSAPSNSFSAMIDTGNSLYTWGSNANGVAAGGSGATPSLRSASPGIGAWKKLAVGSNFTVGVTNSGQIWGWGEASPVTELFSPGNPGSNIGITRETTLGSAWSDVTITGAGAVLAVRNDGTLWAAGHNGDGTLGNGTFVSTTTWIQTGGGTSDWYRVSGGDGHVLAIKLNGTLWAWGTGTAGQLGLGNNTSYNTPQQVGVVNTWAAISAGAASSFAVRHNGTLWAFGRNVDGQLGVGDTTNRASPTQVGTSTLWTRVAAGYNHAMGLRSDGTLWTWGNNSQGQLGLDATSPPITSPVVVDGSTSWSGVFAGYQVSMGVNGPSAVEVASRQAFYDTPGTYSFVVPQGVTSICALAIGGGGGGMQYSFGDSPEGVGGGGGALSYRNNVPVNPGDVLTVVVGAGGLGNTDPNPNLDAEWFGQDGGDSYVLRVSSNTYAAYAEGGQGGASGGGGLSTADGGRAFVGGGGPLGYAADGGGDGGNSWEGQCGGGGAGGYDGDGGTSTNSLDNSNPFPGDNGKPAQVGSGGGGAGKSGNGASGAGGGGGVGVYVIGADGGGQSTTGGGGFGGSGGQNGQSVTAGDYNGGDGGLYGGGGGSGDDFDTNNDATTGEGGNGARGCVYIIWGPGRTFPSASQLVT